MIRFGDYLKSKVIHEAASQKYKIMMKRPVTFFDGYEKIKLPQPAKLSSSDTKMELQEVRDAMIMSNEKLQYERKLDVDYLDMLSDVVGGEAELIKAMSYKKAIKKVLMIDAKFSGWITYINKKGNVQTKVFNNGKIVH